MDIECGDGERERFVGVRLQVDYGAGFTCFDTLLNDVADLIGDSD